MAYIVGEMPKSKDTKRLEVHLMPEVIDKLQELAKFHNRTTKNYVETVLIQVANGKAKIKFPSD